MLRFNPFTGNLDNVGDGTFVSYRLVFNPFIGTLDFVGVAASAPPGTPPAGSPMGFLMLYTYPS